MKVGGRPWRFVGWLLKPIQFAVLCGLASVVLSYAFGWASGWDLAWSFVVPTGAMLLIETLNWWMRQRRLREPG